MDVETETDMVSVHAEIPTSLGDERPQEITTDKPHINITTLSGKKLCPN